MLDYPIPQPIGCSESEIKRLEEFYNVSLPRTYREFLRYRGHESGTVFLGTDVTYEHLFEIRGYAEELLDENPNTSFSLEPHHFVFALHQGYLFSFFDVRAGDDPPTYFMKELDREPTKEADTFSETLRKHTYTP